MAGGIELDHQVLLDTPVAGFLLPVSYFRFPTSRTHCERISERIANACSITKCCCWIPWWPSLVECSQAIELPRAAGGIELYRDLLLDTPVAVGIELDHQVLLLDTPVAVTRGMLISWVPLKGVSTDRPPWEQY